MGYKYDFSTRDGMLEKLRAYAANPDDDTIRIKAKIKDMFMHCPELLYALDAKEYEDQLFDKDGNLNIDENGEPLGEWDSYFGENSYIRPYLYIPEIQTKMNCYVCYQVSFSELQRYNEAVKYCIITFTVFVNGGHSIDELTGIPRHDLIAGIIREKFAWTGLTTASAVPVKDEESMTDTHYLVRTLQFQAELPNNLVKTTNGKTSYNNKRSY